MVREIEKEYTMTTLTKHELLANLGDKNVLTRQHARLILVHQGEENIPAFIRALNSPNNYTRLEATRALGDLHTQDAALALSKTLMDEDFSIRWAAMESLLKFGRIGLKPLLEIFAKRFDTIWMREGVHHVLRVMKDRHDLNDTELHLFEVLDKQARTNFNTGWTGEEAWATEKALEVLDQTEKTESLTKQISAI